jgi:alpha-1,3-glucan synthase
MYGVENQDVFRWPGIKDGVKRMLLGLFITTLHMPGIPLLLWGEEQAMYILDNTADNYLFGRQPITSTLAWQDHGCYRLGSSQYHNFPADSVLNGCNDDSVSLDHRDPTHPVRNVIKSMYHLRRNYPVLNDGYFLQSLSKQTHNIMLPGSNGTPTETGMWSVLRDKLLNVQTLEGGNQSVWLVYQNDNKTVNYEFDCYSKKSALISAFDAGTTVKNLLSPYEEIKLENSTTKLGIDFSENFNGCLQELTLAPYAFKAYVPLEAWLPPLPMMTKFLPGHDARLRSTVSANEKESVDVELRFSEEMDCSSVTQKLVLSSTTEDGSNAQLVQNSVSCSNIADTDAQSFSGAVPSTWTWKAKLLVANGVHSLTVNNASSIDGRPTESVDHLLFRIGQANNPMVFPRQANYSTDALSKDSTTNTLIYSHKAAGADKFRYSLNWKSSWSDWIDYKGGNVILPAQPWSGTKQQKWDGHHAIIQYWSKLTGSSNHIQQADADWGTKPPRRFPHLFANGPFNEFGFDGGLQNSFQQDSAGNWSFHLMTEWPSNFQANVWGMNPDGQPDQTFVYGDIDNDTVLDRLPPDSLTPVIFNLSSPPDSPFLAYQMQLNDGDYRFHFVPVGSRLNQIILFALLWVVPITTGVVSIWTYMGFFYGVKFNKIGVMKKKNILPFFRRKFERIPDNDEEYHNDHKLRDLFLHSRRGSAIPLKNLSKRRTVLIATMEYDIEDWAIKIKIGGLGVMAQLMGKSLEHQDLIWVVPCVGGIDYPTDTGADPMTITVLDKLYTVQVQYHQLNNITYVLLDAPIFRQQSKTEPYPPRMDDLDSAIYYSAWNACIAQTIKRFPIDIYHINDYHGAAAPLYLLPETIPCCLSLHNAEFQGLWPMRTPQEREEVSKVYNLEPSIVEKYVQFGEVFNRECNLNPLVLD